MKTTTAPRRTAFLLTLLAVLPGFARAHPGHSALDWFSTPPHLGHEQEYAIIVITLALIALGCAAYWLASRRR